MRRSLIAVVLLGLTSSAYAADFEVCDHGRTARLRAEPVQAGGADL